MLNEQADRCTATTRDGDRCKNPAVNGAAVCRMHGGQGGKGEVHDGNSHAVTTGEHETITYDTLDEEERRLWHQVDTDPLVQVNAQIRLHKIRQRRLMKRLQRLQGTGMVTVERETEKGQAGEGAVDLTRERGESEVEVIQRTEEALTRLQKELRKLLREKYRILQNEPADQSEKLDVLLSRMDSMRDDAPAYQSPEPESSTR